MPFILKPYELSGLYTILYSVNTCAEGGVEGGGGGVGGEGVRVSKRTEVASL